MYLYIIDFTHIILIKFDFFFMCLKKTNFVLFRRIHSEKKKHFFHLLEVLQLPFRDIKKLKINLT